MQTGEKRVLFWYGMLIIPKKIREPNKNDLCMRFSNNYFYWFKRADVFPTLPLGLPAFFNNGCDVPSDETSDYGEAPSDESSKNESNDDEDDGEDGDDSEDGASGTPKVKKEKKKKTKRKSPKLRKYTKKSKSPHVSEEALASRIAVRQGRQTSDTFCGFQNPASEKLPWLPSRAVKQGRPGWNT